MPVPVYPADDHLLSERHRHRRDPTPVPPSRLLSSAKEWAASVPNSVGGGRQSSPVFFPMFFLCIPVKVFVPPSYLVRTNSNYLLEFLSIG